MRKVSAVSIIFLMIILSGCGESGITVTGDNATITTNSETNNAQAIVDTDVNADVNVTNDKSTVNDDRALDDKISESSLEDSEIYQQLKKEYDQLCEVNNELSEENAALKKENDTLKYQAENIPEIQYKNIGLSVDGDIISINDTDSSVIIDGRTYYSEEFVTGLIDNNKSVTVKDDMMYIGKIIKGEAYLLDCPLFNTSGVYQESNLKDSYDMIHTNALVFYNDKNSIIYNLNNDYSFIKFNLSIMNDAYLDREGILQIKADDTIVYTSPVLTKKTQLIEEKDISINNCSLLTIEYSRASSGRNPCIMSDIVVYNLD